MSENPGLLSITDKGMLLAHREGVVRVRAAESESTLTVTVLAPSMIRVQPERLRLRAGATASVHVVTGDGTQVPPEGIQWSTRVPEIAQAHEGLVRAGKVSGRTEVTATFGVAAATLQVEVAGSPVPTFTISPSRMQFHSGEIVSFQALSAGGPLEAEWTSTKEASLSSLQGSLFKALEPGEATVCARIAKRTVCRTIEVSP